MIRATSTTFVALALAACFTIARAEESLVGKYSGTMPVPSIRGGLGGWPA